MIFGRKKKPWDMGPIRMTDNVSIAPVHLTAIERRDHSDYDMILYLCGGKQICISEDDLTASGQEFIAAKFPRIQHVPDGVM